MPARLKTAEGLPGSARFPAPLPLGTISFRLSLRQQRFARPLHYAGLAQLLVNGP